METIWQVIGFITCLNTVVLSSLIYIYLRDKDSDLQDEGTADTEQED